MLSSLRKAYKVGWRAGAAEPGTETVNGHKYLRRPQCPYEHLRHAVFILLWQQGYYNGMAHRLTQKGE